MKIKNFKQFESIDWDSENNFVHDLEDITLELKDEGMLVDIRLNRSTRTDIHSVAKPSEYEVRISKPGFKNIRRYLSILAKTDLIEWSEIKDTVIRLTEYCYENGWSVRFWADGTEFLTGCKKEEDFTIGDGITQFSFRMLITRL
jgi:hypothetical protein